MNLSKFALRLLLILATHNLMAKTYYVSSGGDDLNTGVSADQAWATIDRVNKTSLFPGDKVLFEGGSTFFGSMFFNHTTGGSSEEPILISSFGEGRAVINSGISYGLKIYNTAGFRITSLIFRGDGRILNNTSGIDCFVDKDKSRFNYIFIDSVEVYGYRKSGISIGSWKGASGFDDVIITHCKIHNNGDAGISTYAEEVIGHRNFYIAYTEVFDNSGLPDKTHLHSGNGIVLGGVDGATIEYCEAYNNGWLNAWRDGGPVGIWGWSCNNLTIQFNESHHNKTGTGKDGGGFDIDGGCTNCVLQYNYSHDNEGAGYLIAQYYYAPPMSNVVIRYNISENDARKNSYGAIHLWSSGSNGGIQNAKIYNNTIYLTPSANGSPKAIFIQSNGINNTIISNNIFQTTGGATLVQVNKKSGLKFIGNNYWSTDSDAEFKWLGNSYSSLKQWRESSKQELLNNLPVGSDWDPELKNAGQGVIVSPKKLYNFRDYEIQQSSAITDKGLDLAVLYDINIGKIDFWGNCLEQRESWSIGAHQPTEQSTFCLKGGVQELTFGQFPDGIYSGPGVVEKRYFDPEVAGIGNHALQYRFSDEEGRSIFLHYTVTVVESTSTEWLGLNNSSHDWFDSQNWSNCVPTSTVDAVIAVRSEIPDNATFSMPIIKSNQHAQTKDILVDGHLQLEAGSSLSIFGTSEIAQLNAEDDSNVLFSNNADQTIPAGVYGTLTLLGDGKKILTGDVKINHELDLQNSKLQLDDHNLTIGSLGSVVSYSNSAYIITNSLGKMIYEDVKGDRIGIFPVGTEKSYLPATVQNVGQIDDFSVRVIEGVLSEGTTGETMLEEVVNFTWHVDEKVKGESNVILGLQWNAADELANFSRQESYISHYKNSNWSSETLVTKYPTIGTEENSFTRELAGITSFSPFAVTSHGGVALPVTLTHFNIAVQGTTVVLSWKTATEINNLGFAIEVSEDAQNYHKLGFVSSTSSNSNQPQSYTFHDTERHKSGIRYYRLAQEDLNGKVSYSKVQSISFSPDLRIAAYPNPFSENIHLEIVTDQMEIVNITIEDKLGHHYMTTQTLLMEGSNTIDHFNMSHYPPGLYLLSVQSENKVRRLKIIRN